MKASKLLVSLRFILLIPSDAQLKFKIITETRLEKGKPERRKQGKKGNAEESQIISIGKANKPLTKPIKDNELEIEQSQKVSEEARRMAISYKKLIILQV